MTSFSSESSSIPATNGLIVAIGVGCIIYGIILSSFALKTLSWIETEGKLIQSGVEYRSYGEDMDREYRVMYSFQAGSNTHIGTRISYGRTFSRTLTQNKLERADPLTVYHHPEHPRRAVLVPGFTFGVLWPLLTGILLLGTGLFSHWRGTSLTDTINISFRS
ncbi:DUF3592 domain-containing protein [Balneolaceae bacterium ANBcel3]|nr:DUF3592 domain-containing protein [Balneolaceae bacterium ANBcel3]